MERLLPIAQGWPNVFDREPQSASLEPLCAACIKIKSKYYYDWLQMCKLIDNLLKYNFVECSLFKQLNFKSFVFMFFGYLLLLL